MVKELIAQGYSEDEVVQILVDNDFSRSEARQIVAQELGHDDADDYVKVPTAPSGKVTRSS